MKTKFERAIVVLKLFMDATIVAVSFILGYALKFKTGYYAHAQVEPYLAVLPFVIVLWLIAFAGVGLYRMPKGLMSALSEFASIVNGCVIGTFEVMAFTFVYRDFPDSRYVIFYSLLVAIALMFMGRTFIRLLQHFFYKRGIGVKKAAIVGGNDYGQMLAEKISLYPSNGYLFKGFLLNRKPKKIRYHLKSDFSIIGKPNDYQKILHKENIKALFITDESFDNKFLLEMIAFCSNQKIEVNLIPNIYELRLSHMDMCDFDGVPLIKVKRLSFSLSKMFVKRVFDLIGGLILFVLAAPIMLAAIVLIKIYSPGPVFYSQERISLNGKVFKFLKFRSMEVGAEKDTGPAFTTKKSNPKTTKLGKFLRKSSIDELPQLINVIRGEMSLVGPRPERPYFVKKFIKKIPNYNERFLVKGGITGWAQVNGRAALTLEPAEKLSYDLYYIEKWSLLFDIEILLKTVVDVFLQKEVY